MMVNSGEQVSQDIIYDIVEAVAEHRGVAVCELPPLYETIDTEALNSFLQCFDGTDDRSRSVEFTYCGYRVSVNSAGRVRVRPTS